MHNHVGILYALLIVDLNLGGLSETLPNVKKPFFCLRRRLTLSVSKLDDNGNVIVHILHNIAKE